MKLSSDHRSFANYDGYVSISCALFLFVFFRVELRFRELGFGIVIEILHIFSIVRSGWPSGLRRQTQG